MKLKTGILLFLIICTFVRSEAQSLLSRNNLFDADWKFHRGGAQGAESPLFNDSDWRKIDLPHDWSVEDLPGTDSPFDIDAISQVNGGFTTGGTGWYRKSFTVPSDSKGKRFIIMFEGVYMNAEVWLNGRLVGTHPYGYTSFWFDITGRIRTGEENLLAVKVRNEGENSRWYSGSGIYRHVWLQILSPVHIAQWGTYITTPLVTANEAHINVRTTLSNQGEGNRIIRLVTRIIDPNSLEVARTESQETITTGQDTDLQQEMKITRPSLWSVDTPVLYTAISEVYEDAVLTDRVETKFGIRSISFDVVNGFLLNGKPLILKGGCVHHDNGPLGAKAYDRAEERRVELLRASGYNAVRSAHNPPSPAFLDACDRLGMLVIDETFDTWSEPKNPEDYNRHFVEWWKKDTESMILRDRNHPSVIMWSIGNEIPNRHTPEVAAVAKMMADHVRMLDPTRPVTSAVNDIRPDKDDYFAALDVAGYNYPAFAGEESKSLYEQDHGRLPERIIYCSESFPLEAFQSWMGAIDNPYVIGDFVWTAWDYLGEASIGWRGYPQRQNFFPWNLAFCGDIDICGWKRPQSYYRDALWMDNQISVWVTPPAPSFEVNPERASWSKWHWNDVTDSWNWPGEEGKPMEVTVYSSCEQAELFLNGKSLGRKPTNRSTEYKATWNVQYEPGTLKAAGYQKRKQVTSAELKSAGEPARILLTADKSVIRSDGQDLSYITVELVDEKGVRNPLAGNPVSFETEGPGSIIAVGNANPVSLESIISSERKACRGRCMVILKSGSEAGTVTLKVSSPGLKTSEILITTR
ncbi:MAG: DUF4982 domain-containing protein [Bacteroidales bacterium]|nr:DUF4982 domain-containing protein [Bacteroidales bacterium]